MLASPLAFAGQEFVSWREKKLGRLQSRGGEQRAHRHTSKDLLGHQGT